MGHQYALHALQTWKSSAMRCSTLAKSSSSMNSQALRPSGSATQSTVNTKCGSTAHIRSNREPFMTTSALNASAPKIFKRPIRWCCRFCAEKTCRETQWTTSSIWCTKTTPESAGLPVSISSGKNLPWTPCRSLKFYTVVVSIFIAHSCGKKQEFTELQFQNYCHFMRFWIKFIFLCG